MEKVANFDFIFFFVNFFLFHNFFYSSLAKKETLVPATQKNGVVFLLFLFVLFVFLVLFGFSTEFFFFLPSFFFWLLSTHPPGFHEIDPVSSGSLVLFLFFFVIFFISVWLFNLFSYINLHVITEFWGVFFVRLWSS